MTEVEKRSGREAWMRAGLEEHASLRDGVFNEYANAVLAALRRRSYEGQFGGEGLIWEALRTIEEDEATHGELSWKIVKWGMRAGKNEGVMGAVEAELEGQRRRLGVGRGGTMREVEEDEANVDSAGYFERTDADRLRRKISWVLLERVEKTLSGECDDCDLLDFSS
ncbi:hypothetical protein TrRE_jg12788 [Triparma retinervis]|uniref:Uncharacterized protein n=1 Tax=Triparma retinervis TaxID=2557542 RepID=A0A9W6ZB03_9STRA|nr:hypothetical protein TrRE_jg12788 [Triparma retinervis]